MMFWWTLLVALPLSIDANVINTLLTQSLQSSFASSKPLLWGPPTIDRDVVSSLKDYRWVYPNVSASDYIASRYFPHEFQEISKGGLACQLGVSANGGGSVGGNLCDLHKMDFMVDFKPFGPNRALFSFVDFLLLWRSNHASATNATIMFVGDSVTGQVFMAALCDARRNQHTFTVSFHLPTNLPNIAYPTYKTRLVFFEATITLKSDIHFVYKVIYCRQYMYTNNMRVVQAYFAPADVLILGWGLHYYNQDGFTIARPTIFEPIFKVLNQSDKVQDLFWMGPPKLAFRYGNNVDTLGHWTGKRGFCGPTMVHPTIPHHTINRDVQFTLQAMGLSHSWFSWKDSMQATTNHSSRGGGFHMTIIPFEELTSPFFRNYPGFNNDTSVAVEDCAHNCWLPNLYEPLWDALYLGLSRRFLGRASTLFPTVKGNLTCQEVKFRGGGPFLSDQIRESIRNETCY